ncbi:MAG TPA: tetratricopeptide repeat protein [Terriglobales bacterium]|jgi:cytochrome c-type biogenesis protein CcmH/NrfG|nr:tetratricopeptide repeat protein [Terriglobales bacterium]
MANETTTQPTAGSAWQAKQVYAMAVISLVVGLAIGYLFRGSQSPAAPAQPAANAQPAAPAGAMGGHTPSLEEMKQMADKKAAPLLEKLRGDPNNGDLLIQVGNIYKSTHQFKDAVGYYDKALQVDPKNVPIRTEMASCLYYDGDVDGAISQLQQALRYDPKDANSLFNLGMIKWQGKQDSKGAVAAWQQLLKSNPQLSAERKATVQKLMADAQMQGKS